MTCCGGMSGGESVHVGGACDPSGEGARQVFAATPDPAAALQNARKAEFEASAAKTLARARAVYVVALCAVLIAVPLVTLMLAGANFLGGPLVFAFFLGWIGFNNIFSDGTCDCDCDEEDGE